jgi:hypothetical protein
VKRKWLLSIIQTQLSRLYSFAFVVIPDELQASQLLIDGITQYLVKNKSTLMDITDENYEDESFQKKLKKAVLKDCLLSIYSIGSKRTKHLMGSPTDRTEAFYLKMDCETRAVAFLKYKWHFSVDEIQISLGMEKTEIIAKIHQSRLTLKGFPPKLVYQREISRD